MFLLAFTTYAQVWKTLPKGVRVIGYRNVTTSQVSKNFNHTGQENSLGASFRIDASTFNDLTGNILERNLDPNIYGALTIGEYKVDAGAQFNVQGTGFGYGITDNVMFYAELAYFNARVNAKIKRTKGNSYEEVARMLEKNGGIQNNIFAENLRQMIDVNEGIIQSALTNYYGYKPIGDWHGRGYGDMETGFMTKVIDKDIYGLLLYTGMILPTGRIDDPDILQDVGFGDGQFDFFGEVASGYIFNDHINFGTNLRYTHQLPTDKTLRIPNERDYQLSSKKGVFQVKYGDKINWSINSTLNFNNWISFTPIYRIMYQKDASYESNYENANSYLRHNSSRLEHQVQLTTTLSSIKPFLNKDFLLPAQINMNFVKTTYGKNVPSLGRFELELRMLF